MYCNNFGTGRKLDELCKQNTRIISVVRRIPKKHAFKLYFSVLGYFFRDVAINVNRNLLFFFFCFFFRFYTKFDKLFLKTERTDISSVNSIYCIILLAFQP